MTRSIKYQVRSRFELTMKPNTYTLSNINAANYAQTCSRAEASTLAKTFRVLEKHTSNVLGARRRFGAIAAAFEARASELTPNSAEAP